MGAFGESSEHKRGNAKCALQVQKKAISYTGNYVFAVCMLRIGAGGMLNSTCHYCALLFALVAGVSSVQL